MLRQIVTSLGRFETKRLISTSVIGLNRVTIVGAAGGIGQAMAMLMKADPLVTDLVLLDLKKEVNGIAADVSHIDTFSGVKAFVGADKMADALSCTNLIIVAAGVPRSPTMNTRDKLFDANAEIIYQVALHKAKKCPEAFLAIITNPVNALIPFAAEILKQNDAYDPKKLFGITKLDSTRARTFIADFLVVDPAKLNVKVIGGHSDTTIVPVISQTSPAVKGDRDDIEKIYGRIRTGGTAVLKAKESKGTAQLSIAYAASTFCNSLLQGMEGKSGVTDVAFVESTVCSELKFFSSIFDIGKEGIKKFHPMPEMNDFEMGLLEKAMPELKANIEQGVKAAEKKKGTGKKEKQSKCET